PRKVDVQIIAATDALLDQAVAAGRFSSPLLHRLAGVELWVPPLRERREDVTRLLLFALGKELERLGSDFDLDDSPDERPWLDAHTVASLCRYRWPGNVRELMNVARQIALALPDKGRVRPEDLPVLQRIAAAVDGRGDETTPPSSAASPSPTTAVEPPDTGDDKLNKDRVQEALQQARWSIPGAARRLGVAKTTL
ncbi:MAG: sigma-54-dependent Fis family transcriptional regulator, partial [Planctomycetes bacterium]|nr:sigma-54-dependent Fis family transcriptional regulator [Planctomycetota bacterium]